MKIYISGVNPENKIAEIVESLGHEVILSEDTIGNKGGEDNSHSKVLEADLVIFDHTVKRGIEDHLFADEQKKPMLSLIPESDRRELAPYFKFLEEKGVCEFKYFSSQQDIDRFVKGFLTIAENDKERLSAPSKEMR
ncbi:hypothetical protein IID21_04805 [Patescibacteria group bacterium]|nr:hypothetical protein [Patescibacteria group bacterium]